jgi:hypothetical protein
MIGHGAAHRTTRRAAVVAAAIVCVLAGCVGQAPPAPSSPAAPPSLAAGSLPPGRPVWMLSRDALADLVADPVIHSELDDALIYEILQPGQEPLAGVSAIATATFPSVAGLSRALASGRLPAGVRAVLYDPEAWSFTPAAEQRDPAQAAARAADLVRAHGLQLIVAPALNLTSALSHGSGAPRWQQFLDLRLAAKIARVAGVVELQAQSLERSTRTYAAFVRRAAGQARDANSAVTVLAGLSTNPPGAAVLGRQLVAAIDASRASVGGYWLNIPGRGPRCPTCNQKRPDVGIEALRAVL